MPVYNLGNYYHFYERDYLTAISLYEKSSVLNPSFLNNWISIGSCYFKMGNKFKALESFYKALEIDPYNQMVLYNIQMVIKNL